ncbi:SDR family NAD(P)-dependent oxidoreductase [Pseudonocardia humida]|uniref:SDR family oxidoreductase n=1 Tax=Pseudonocardia humida TaxID=2800819 RepID=A0ABT0ZWW4_9PSEU|nr:SDR family oxidoreductase [Pseudonocardia humida]MCO1655129.1 SDR family oxidoreductase [Pseudonocardia humida]
MGRLDAKTAIVTGGANGLGEAIATRMTEEGATVAVLDVDADGGRRVAAALPGATFHACDVTREADVEAAIGAAVAAHGRLDVLVNNAGITGAAGPSHELALADWERVMAVNSTAVFLCTKHAVPHLRAAGEGSVVNISSIFGLVGSGGIPAYHASKGAVRAMTKTDALAYAPDRIRVNSIHPGYVWTEMVRASTDRAGLSEPDARARLDPLHPLGGVGRPDDIAWGVVYLASDEARWVTGAELVIDGGYTAR